MGDTGAVGRNPRVRCAIGSDSAGNIDIGVVIVPAVSGRTYTVVGGWMRSHGNAATATSVDIKDTAGTPVVAVACTVAGLTDHALLRFGTATTAEFNTANTTMTKHKGLQILTTGSPIGTASAIDWCVYYTVST